MRTTCLALAAGLMLTGLAGAVAQEAGPRMLQVEPPKEGAVSGAASRYTFNRVDGGFLRLDSVNGQVSFCSQRSVGWACQAVPEDRLALDSEIARLQAEIAGLKTQLAGLQSAPPPRPPGELTPPAAEGDAKLKFPTREEMERARGALEKAWRHLVDMISELQKDLMKKG